MSDAKVDPKFVTEMIQEFVRSLKQNELNEAKLDLEGLQPGKKMKFSIVISGDPNDWESFTSPRVEVEATLADALKTAISCNRKDHPGWMEPKYFTVQIVTLSGKRILLPQALWEDTLHEVFHDMDITHASDLPRLTVFGLGHLP